MTSLRCWSRWRKTSISFLINSIMFPRETRGAHPRTPPQGSVLPAVPPDELNKLAQTMIFAGDTVLSSNDPHEDLLLGITDGDDKPTANAELLDQRLRDFRAAGCNQDAVIGRVVAPADRSVKPFYSCVVASELSDVCLSHARQFADSFDGKHAARHFRQHCCLIAGARSYFEHRRVFVNLEQFGHTRDHVRLRDRLHIAYRQRVVSISLCSQRVRHK